jgi:hypothetical protein
MSAWVDAPNPAATHRAELKVTVACSSTLHHQLSLKFETAPSLVNAQE